MKIRYLFPLLLFCCCLLSACQQGEGTESRPGLAIVDMARVMRDSEPGKAGVQFLEAMQASMQQELDTIQQKLEKDTDNEALQLELQQVLMIKRHLKIRKRKRLPLMCALKKSRSTVWV